MAKKKTKLEKMSKKERTSLAYALATNLAKHGKPQSPTNERKLTKGEENKKEKNVMKFKKAFDLEEIKRIKENLKNPEKADLNKDGKLSDYEEKRGAAIEKAVQKEELQLVHVYDKDGKMYGTGSVEKVEGDKTVVRFDGSTVKRFPSDRVKPVKEAVSKAIQKEGDLDLGHQDNEPHMLKSDLYRIAKYAAELYKMVDQFDVEGQEVDFPHWWQAKIITSKEAMVKAKHYLDGELQVDKIDSMLSEDSKEYKVLSTKELNRLAALPPTDRSFRKDSRYKGKVEIGDELIMVDRNSPAYGRKGKVVRLTQDGVEVDFGRGDKYGIISRRIKGNKITS